MEFKLDLKKKNRLKLFTTYSIAGCKIPSDVKAVTDFSTCDHTAMQTHKFFKNHENPGK